MTDADLIGWVGTALVAASSLGIAHKKPIAWFGMMVSNTCFAISGAMSNLPSLVAASVLLFALDVYGYCTWKR